MSKYGIIVLVDKCAGCHACAIACKEENQVAPGIFYERIRRFENAEARYINYFRASCQHCENPACMKVCPAKAIHKGPAGEVLVDEEKCIGCQMCARACPYGVPQFNTSGNTNYFGDKMPLAVRDLEPWQKHRAGRAEHCTLCTHRTSQGRPPACVEACGIGAMVWVDYENPTKDTEKLIAAAKMMNKAAGTEPKVRYIARHMDVEKYPLKL
ncbi:4Fe-4S dicluster domain-containing protein [Sutterella sp.]|uniref:4Fe-4S dicluster domain-containing protein n=1 Tax=Sutterella sp. TaxID=1981025 RepID=UPI0026E08B70|nr:4Fe-4S dicluster domain-containing protein [Sutterella sp.]MDO5530597.1 4Fe-4S dicluster domain-containing protein [Sutterella sp.]